MFNPNQAPLLYDSDSTFIKECKIKKSFYILLSSFYGLFLFLFSVVMIYELIIRDDGCNNYVPYFLLFILGGITYFIMLNLNIISSMTKKVGKNLIILLFILLFVGCCFKIAFIIFSFVVYNRSYGDCYFPYNKQLVFMIGSFLEGVFLIAFEISWKNLYKDLARIYN